MSNLTSFLPQTDFKPTAGLGGAIEGMRTALGMPVYEQQLLEMGLGNQANILKNYQTWLDEKEVNPSKRKKEAATYNYETDWINSGRKRQRDDLQDDLAAENILSTRINRAATRLKLDSDSEDRAGELATRFLSAGHTTLSYPKIWEDMKSVGMVLPDDPAMAYDSLLKLASSYADRSSEREHFRTNEEAKQRAKTAHENKLEEIRAMNEGRIEAASASAANKLPSVDQTIIETIKNIKDEGMRQANGDPELEAQVMARFYQQLSDAYNKKYKDPQDLKRELGVGVGVQGVTPPKPFTLNSEQKSEQFTLNGKPAKVVGEGIRPNKEGKMVPSIQLEQDGKYIWVPKK